MSLTEQEAIQATLALDALLSEVRMFTGKFSGRGHVFAYMETYAPHRGQEVRDAAASILDALVALKRAHAKLQSTFYTGGPPPKPKSTGADYGQ